MALPNTVTSTRLFAKVTATLLSAAKKYEQRPLAMKNLSLQVSLIRNESI